MKRIAVIVRAGQTGRVVEALRAAVGLGLRGDRIEAVLTAPALPALVDPRAARAVATLAELGHAVVGAEPDGPGAGPDAVAAAVRRADAVEVWT